MGEILDYRSRLGDPASRKFETFSYLPEMDREKLTRQIECLVARGLNPAIEHTEPDNAFGHYWYMWKLPMFGERNVNRILGEAEACRDANPGHHVRLIGYDNHAQSQGMAMVIFRGK